MDNLEIFPLSPGDFDGDENFDKLAESLPILPIRNIVLFPGMVIPVTVGRQKSIRLVKKAYKGNRTVGVLTQASPQKEEPTKEDLYRVGTVAHILKMIVLPDGNITIIIQGKKRFEVQEFIREEPLLLARVRFIDDNFPPKPSRELKALVQSLRESATKILHLNPEIPREAQIALDNIESNNFLVHFLSSNLNADLADKQSLLETFEGVQQGTMLLEYMLKDIELLELKREIQSKASSDIDQQQRDYYIRQQIKVLQEELGIDSPEQELDNLRAKAAKKKWSKEVNDHFQKELQKLQRMNAMSAEYPLTMNYVELMVDLPWNEYSKDSFDLKKAQKVLDNDHFGLEKVKERIIEYLAVLKMKGNLKAPILCLYGPPGVGKTSLGKSIAKALGRKYARMSLGGVHDEAEIRGHRKTYIGAMPGKLVQNIRKAKTSNPVFILDEIDKVSSDFRGDPSSALLEVLDPEQNHSFLDNYLEVEYDLSKVLFIATANALDTVQPALRDRMEIIEISGYTMEEKVQIAKKYLIPKQKKDHGLDRKTLSFTDAAVQKIVEGYTRESGVRALEQKIGSLIRKITKAIALEEDYPKQLTPKDVIRLLGAETFENDLYDNNDTAGVVTGLAWTSVGGEILFVETSLSRGRGQLTLSGQLGDVMKESAMTALSYLKAHTDDLDIDYRIFDHYNLHVHVPAGAVPKDGPSAGITMLTSMASIFSQRKVKQHLAMTGEITLRGKVLPVGGIKEKILAAKRAGINEIVMSSKNRKDVEEINTTYLGDLTFHYVDRVDEVLAVALLPEKVLKPLKFEFPKEKEQRESELENVTM
ncbi:MAG: endopeptidase La [Cytophagaceae bacterium]|nr:endopeptidase La [Cytophagaceae bacterium]